MIICRDVDDPQSGKLGVDFLIRTVAQLEKVEGFNSFVSNQITPMIYTIPLNPKLNFEDAQSLSVLNELSLLQKTILDKYGDAYKVFLVDTFFPSFFSGWTLDRSVLTVT